jgi:hypothetical protein
MVYLMALSVAQITNREMKGQLINNELVRKSSSGRLENTVLAFA